MTWTERKLNLEDLTAKIVVSSFAHNTEFADWVQAVNNRILALEKAVEESQKKHTI